MELPGMIRPELQKLPQIGDADVTVVWVGKQGVRYCASGHRSEDTMKTARKKLDDVSDYKFATLAS